MVICLIWICYICKLQGWGRYFRNVSKIRYQDTLTQYPKDTVRYSILKKYLRYDTDTRYRHLYRVPVSIGCIHSIRAVIIVTCVLIDESPVQVNSSGMFTAVVSISSGGQERDAEAADVILKYLYLLPDVVSERYSKILSKWNVS